MGVNLGGLFPVKQIQLENLTGKKIAIDAFNTIFQFLSSIRDRFTGEPLRDSKGNVTSHLSGLFYRTAKLLENGITPIYVFDGEPPAFKMKTVEERKKIRAEAEVKWKEALSSGDVESVRKYSQGASKVTTDMLIEAKRLLDAMGVSWVQAPSEGEAQAIHFVKKGEVYAVGTQDWDALLFGAERVVRNLTLSGKKKVAGKQAYNDVSPELVELNIVLGALGINHDQLILMGILVGTDFDPGVKGYGPKKALELVKKEKTLEAVKKAVNWSSEVKLEEIFDFFKNPPVQDVQIVKKSLDENLLKKILVEDHDFGGERVDSIIKKFKSYKPSGLGSFFKV
ncbi:MAG: flap endonuclease-1 [Candidatus Aenigmarchaeota archaeon]|nr:flap endonuclease-1 [Candidatus Aenigmarchaeota archaeon]